MTEKGGYLGIDESNHGRFPEIFVAVYSKTLSDIIRSKKKDGIGKKRRNSKVLSHLGPRSYKHLLISQEEARLLGERNRDRNIRIVAFSELIKSFMKSHGSLEAILIDGQGSRALTDRIRAILYPLSIPKPSFKKKGDNFYPLINYADGIANILHRHYSNLNSKLINEGKKYKRTKIPSQVEGYCDLLMG